MKLYIAGSYDKRKEINNYAVKIREAFPSITIDASWLSQGEESEEIERLGHQHFIDCDLSEIERCDVFLLINVKELSIESTGKWFEFGYAYAMPKSIIIWGRHQYCIFAHDKSIAHVESFSDALICLETFLAVHKENTWREQWKSRK